MIVRVLLGRSGLQVSPICYGTWQLSPRFWGDQPQEVVLESIRHAFDLGINFIDTADAYGDGYAEQILGKALAELPRDELVLATKVFHHFDAAGNRHPDLTGDYVLTACEASLRRLRTDRIDLYQLHSFDPLTDPTSTIDALEKLRQQGKIGAYGCSNWTVEQIRMGQSLGANLMTGQPRYNLIHRQIEGDLLPYCLAHEIGVLVYSPLLLGLLTGKFDGRETFSDVRRSNPDFQGDRFQMICDRVRQLRPIASGYDLTIVQLVLAVTLMHPAITCVIVGIKTPRQIEEAVGAMGKTISIKDAHQIREILRV